MGHRGYRSRIYRPSTSIMQVSSCSIVRKLVIWGEWRTRGSSFAVNIALLIHYGQQIQITTKARDWR